MPCLVAPKGTANVAPELQAASKAVHDLITLTSDSTWCKWRCGQHPEPLQSVIKALADESLFRCLAALMVTAVPYMKGSGSHVIPAEALILHLMSEYSAAVQRLSSKALTNHAPWLLLAVPKIMQCSTAVVDHFNALIPSMLESILQRSPKDVRCEVISTACHLSTAAHRSSEDVIVCSLNMLSALVHGLHRSAGRITAQHVVAFSRLARLLISLLPHAARVELTGVLIHVSGTQNSVLEVPIARCFVYDGMDEDDDEADSAFTPGATWFLPCDACVESPFLDPPDRAVGSVQFPTAVAATEVIAAQVHACVRDTSFSDADGVREMSLWLFTILSLSRADPLLSEKIVIAWATAPCQLIRVIWQKGLQMLVRDGVVDSNSIVNLKTESWQLDEPVQPWMVPLTILCRVYSQYVSTAPDDALFGDQVRSHCAPES